MSKYRPIKDADAASEKQDRRKSDNKGLPGDVDAKALGGVSHDDLGNAVWEWRVDVPRRREDDPTIDLLECLDVDGMTLEDDDDQDEPEEFNPYDKSR